MYKGRSLQRKGESIVSNYGSNFLNYTAEPQTPNAQLCAIFSDLHLPGGLCLQVEETEGGGDRGEGQGDLLTAWLLQVCRVPSR